MALKYMPHSLISKRHTTGGVKDHSFLTACVNPNINYIFGILASRAIKLYINESILGGWVGSIGFFGRF